MKLKTFNTTNVQSLGRTQSPFFQVNSSTGLFNINKTAAELIGLKDNSQIQFHQSEDDPADWYVEVVKTDGFVVRYKENVGKGFLFNSTKLCRLILDSIAYTGNSGRIYIGESVKNGKQILFTLITAKLINQ